jgi:hypothetical protein
MTLWINPFLDVFYKWGLDEYWNDKHSFITFLDMTLPNNLDKNFKEYIKENVPEWYWGDGWSMNIGGAKYEDILKCWEEDTPFQWPPVLGGGYISDWSKERPNDRRYEKYPKYLKDNNMMLSVYPSTSHHIRLVEIGGTWMNSLYFTTERGKSWCNISLKPIFINWINRNPMEVKE